jgi:hypothetical protein
MYVRKYVRTLVLCVVSCGIKGRYQRLRGSTSFLWVKVKVKQFVHRNRRCLLASPYCLTSQRPAQLRQLKLMWCKTYSTVPIIRNSVLSDVPCRKAPFYQQSTQHVAEWITLPHRTPSAFCVLSCDRNSRAAAGQALAWLTQRKGGRLRSVLDTNFLKNKLLSKHLHC